MGRLFFKILAAIAAFALPLCATAQEPPDRQRHTLIPGTVDLSFLNHKPAGSKGRVRAEGERLVYPDGTEARFWGVNIQGGAIFATSDRSIRTHARRLAQLGVNLVRLHHHDSHWVSNNVFADTTPPSTRRLDPRALDRIDLWVKALRDEGIYVWMDIHVGRRMLPGDDIGLFADAARGKDWLDPRGYNFVNPDIHTRMKEFAAAYFDRENRYTGLRYTEDPAILAVLITNENDITHHFGNRLLPDKGVPEHTRLFRALSDGFAERTGLNPRQTWRSWEFGPSKLFLADLEARVFADMIAQFRDMGYDGLVVPTNIWGGNTLAAVPSLMQGDMIDVHAYAGREDSRKNPAEKGSAITTIGAATIAGKPVAISEWNATQFPDPQRYLQPLRVAAIGAFQGWDAPMLYGYAQAPLDDTKRAFEFHTANDPTTMVAMPAAALMFRQGHLSPPLRTVTLTPKAEDVYDAPFKASTSLALRSAVETHGLRVIAPGHPALGWYEPPAPPAASDVIAAPNHDFHAAGAREIRTDTGEYIRDFVDGRITIVTERTLAVAGNLGGAAHGAGHLTVALANAEAGVVLQSLSDAPVAGADALSLTIAAPSEPEQKNRLPYLVDLVSGEISFDAPVDLRLVAPDPGRLAPNVTHRVEGTRHTVTLTDLPGAMWLRFGR